MRNIKSCKKKKKSVLFFFFLTSYEKNCATVTQACQFLEWHSQFLNGLRATTVKVKNNVICHLRDLLGILTNI